MKLPITAIIVTYHSDAVLAQCIASLTNVEEIIVTNNGGTTTPEGVTFLHNRKNLGFGRAINRAVGKVKTPYVLLINPDAMMQPGALETLYQTAQHYPEAAILSPLLEDHKGRARSAWRIGHFEPRALKTKQDIAGVFCVGHIAAAVWLISLENLKKIGLFDKRIFLFFEDDDLSLRFRNAGLCTIIEPAARAIHLQGKSSPKSARSIFIKNFHYVSSELYVTHKHCGKKAAFRVWLRSLNNNFFRLFSALLRLDRFAALAALARLSAAAIYIKLIFSNTSTPQGAVAQLDRASVS
jgi:GT2 family glycosyltransferase